MTVKSPRTRSRWRPAVMVVIVASLAAACGGSDERTLVGYRIEPVANVGSFTVENATANDEPFALRADPGRLLAVFLGFTNCPDACPTAMLEMGVVLDRLGPDAEPIDVAMLTVDPTRDTPAVLTDYVRYFLDDGIALRSEDTTQLRQLADTFGATYDTAHDLTGMTTDVGHTDHTYLIDDGGNIILTWTSDMTIDDLENDLRILLEDLPS